MQEMKFENIRGFTVLEVIIVLVIIGIIASLGGGNLLKSGDGQKVGVVVKYSYEGVVIDTWEGNLILGGQGAISRDAWSFSIDNNTVSDDLNKALKTQQLVSLHYHRPRLPNPFKGATKNFVYKVEFLK